MPAHRRARSTVLPRAFPKKVAPGVVWLYPGDSKPFGILFHLPNCGGRPGRESNHCRRQLSNWNHRSCFEKRRNGVSKRRVPEPFFRSHYSRRESHNSQKTGAKYETGKAPAHQTARFERDLQRVNDPWPNLAEPIKTAIRVLVGSSAGPSLKAFGARFNWEQSRTWEQRLKSPEQPSTCRVADHQT